MSSEQLEQITVKYGKLKKMMKALEQINPTDDTDINFEFVVGSCFPNILENIKKALHTQYTKGYLTGLKEGKETDNTKLN